MIATGGLFAATAALPISGVIGASTTVTFSVISVADLTLDSASEIVRALGDLTENSNSDTGYTLTATSTNGAAALAATGILEGDIVANTDTVTYTISYGGVAKAFVNGVSSLKDTASASGGDIVTEITITYTSSGALTADTYRDTITFTITAQ